MTLCGHIYCVDRLFPGSVQTKPSKYFNNNNSQPVLGFKPVVDRSWQQRAVENRTVDCPVCQKPVLGKELVSLEGGV